MDYVLGSVAALVTGNVTPNRPRLMKRALTPTKHQASPNVTPKSELVEDRSIFLSPTLQKKKAVLKKSPKRIFQDTAADDNSENDSSKKVSSPKIEKVKKHLQDDLESSPVSEQQDTSMKSSKKKRNQQNSAPSPNKKSKTGDAEINPPIAQETTSKKKKKKASNQEVEEETVDTKNNLEKSVINNVKPPTVLSKKINKNARRRERKKKIKKKLLAEAAAKGEIIPGKESSSPKKAKHSDIKIKSQIESAIVKSEKGTKKSKKNKENKELSITEEIEHNQNNENQEISSALETKKIKKEKNKKYVEDKTVQEAVETSLTKSKSAATKMDADGNHKSDDDELENDNNISENSNAFGITDTDSDQESADETDSEDENITTEDSTSIKKKKGKDFVNPNAVTQMDTDSEHESDNEIESENEEDVKEELEKTPEENNSSDEEDKAKETKSKKQLKKEEKKKKAEEREVDEDEVKKTVFVGNVLFNSKCKKEIKKLFSKYGAIDTVRIRTVPVKDGRVTPKLAVIKNELHPERTTVNVYVKFQNVSSVYEALKENNTVLNGNHLRVTTSESTGAEHDPRQAIFVGNIPFALEDEALREKFSGCGEIVSVRIVRDKATNAGKGFGYVNFQSKDAVELALSLPEEELTIKNKVLRVKRCSYPVNKGKVGKWNKGPQQENHDSRPPRGGFRGGRGRGSFQSNRGGFQSDRGGVQPNRGGFHSNRGSSFQSNRGGFQSNRGSFQSRGGFQGRGGFQDRGGRGSSGGRPGFGDRQNSFRGQDNRGGQDERGEGAFRRISHKRKIEEGNQGGPPNKVANDHQPSKEKKARKEFVGVTAEKRKKQKFDKGSKKKKIISEILTKQK